jgi:hypothetical protein
MFISVKTGAAVHVQGHICKFLAETENAGLQRPRVLAPTQNLVTPTDAGGTRLDRRSSLGSTSHTVRRPLLGAHMTVRPMFETVSLANATSFSSNC